MEQTIYLIIGGGQRVRQNVEQGSQTEYQKIENSDWPDKAQCEGQNHFTNALWATDFETVQRWANEWAGEDVELQLTESVEY